MTLIEQAIANVRAIYPRMSQRRAEEIVRAVLTPFAGGQPRTHGKIGPGDEGFFPDPKR